jgi:DNA-binding CsgD family transcriptional regulator
MVGKEVGKIEREREVAKRKSEGFTNYIYPFF